MHARVYYNGRVIEASRARISAVSPASIYGHGVFTTIAIRYGQPFLWHHHWARLSHNADQLRIDASQLSNERLHESLAKLIKANNVHDGRARITLLARHVSGPWRIKGMKFEGCDVLILSGDSRSLPDEGITLTVSPYRLSTLSPLAGVKSVNYLDHLMSWEEARTRDFDEALCLNERGEVVSCARANVFWVREGHLYTPALTTGALAGTTRAHVLELASRMSIPHIEGVFDLPELADADEIFVTSAGLGLVPVHTFDFRSYRLSAGSITVRLREALHQSMLALSKSS